MKTRPKPRTPKQERGRESKNALLYAGLKLFSEKGFYNTNSKEIARDANVSIGTFYMYFTDKKDLFKAVFMDYHLKIKGVLQSIDIEEYVRTGDERKFLNYIIKKLIEAHDIHPEFHQELIVMSQSEPEIKKIHEESQNESIALTKQMLAAWKGKTRIEDKRIAVAAVLVQKTIEEIVHTILFSHIYVPKKRLIDELVDMLFRYLFKAG